jgi:hypothetical protein
MSNISLLIMLVYYVFVYVSIFKVLALICKVYGLTNILIAISGALLGRRKYKILELYGFTRILWCNWLACCFNNGCYVL